MPRKKKTDLEPQGQETILQRPMEEILPQSMLPYAEYVILERALPRVEDGLKPVQRRILYTMLELGITPDKPHRKSARIVGDCLGKYHPHGDTSVYDAMVRMAQPYNMRSVLVDGHGNFGSIDGDSAAAMRYTEARMAPLALEMLRDLEKDTVDFTLNFDDTLREPVVLPGRFPNLLVNGASGIAVGLATNIPPHNLGETIDAVIEIIDHPKCTVDDLMKLLPGPDFPTGGELVQSEEIKKAYETGKGRLILRAKTSIEKGNAGKINIVISELPYQVNKSALLEKILHLSEEKKGPLSAVSDIRDESDRTGMRAVIELKKDTDAKRVLAYLYKSTDLQTSFNVNMVAIAEGKPVQLSLKQALVHYLNHQKNVVLRRTKYDLDKAKAREHILEGLMIAVKNLDAVIRLIRASKSVKEARDGLMKQFHLTEVQAQAVLDLRLYRLTGLEIEALRKEYEDIQKLIAQLKGIIGSERKLLNLIKSELLEVRKKYPQKRLTVITGGEETLPQYTEEKIAQDCILSTDGILIRRAVEKRDVVPEGWMSLQTRTDRKVILFTNLGNCFVLSPEDVAVPRNRDRGSAMAGFLSGWDKEETAVALYDDTVKEDFLFLTRNGFIKRTAGSEYGARKGRSAAINLKEDDRVVAVLKTGKEKDILLLTCRGLSIRFALEEVGATGRATTGVRAVTLGRDDGVLTGFTVQSRGEVLVFSERGYAKRSLLADHERQSRGGKGQKAFTFVKGGANGTRLVGAAVLQKPCAVTVEQKDGTVTKLNSEEILMLPRASRGSLYVLAIGDNVVTKVTVTETETA